MARIKVVYFKGLAALIGEERTLDESTGELYYSEPCDGTTRVNGDFQPQESAVFGGALCRVWYNGRCSIREVRDVTATSPYAAEAPATTDHKADHGKPNWFLLMHGCAKALAGVVRVLTFAVRSVAEGGKGYAPHSWKKVPNAKERYESALYRHLNKIHQGETHDDESGELHWDHIATNALFLSELHHAKDPV